MITAKLARTQWLSEVCTIVLLALIRNTALRDNVLRAATNKTAGKRAMKEAPL